MIHVSVSDVERHFDKYLESAMAEPVAISRSGRDVAVIISAAAFERMSESLNKAQEELLLHRALEDERNGELLSAEETGALFDRIRAEAGRDTGGAGSELRPA